MVTPTSDSNPLDEGATDVSALAAFPRLRDLAVETSASAPSPGQVGLAVRSESEGVLWFLLAGDDATSADIDALARAFVWPSHARARQPSAHLIDGDPFSEAVRARAPGGLVALLSAPEYVQACARALDLLLSVRSRRLSGATAAPRPIGRVLRDFEDAIARADATESNVLLDEAWATGRLSLVNRSLLQSRLLASVRDWDGVIEHAIRFRLPDLELPRGVEQDLIEATYWKYLDAQLREHGPEGAIATFQQDVQPSLGDIFRDHRSASSSAARIVWLVRLAAIGGEWPISMQAEILEGSGGYEDSEQLQAIASLVDFDTEHSARDAANLLGRHEDSAAYSLAEHAVDIPPDVRVGVLAQAAVRLDDPNRVAQAAVALAQVPADSEIAAPTAVIGRVRAHPGPVVEISSWSSWLTAVFEDPNWPDAMRIADDNARAWTEALSHEHGSLSEMAESIEVLAGEETLRAVLPRLVRATIPDGEGRSEVLRSRRRVLRALASAVAGDNASGVADLDAISDLLASLLEAGLSPAEFDELCTQVEGVWRRVGAPPRLARWVVDALGVLLGYPCPDGERRDRAIGSLLAPLIVDTRRSTPFVPREVWLEITDALGESGLGELVPAAVLETVATETVDEAEAFAYLGHKTVLLYTLVPGAAERAAEYLVKLVPSIRVVTDGSHVGGPELRDRARSADAIVIASRAAKHAATDAIREFASVRISWASGKGWSSLVESLRQGTALAD